jgi:signal transduction histidine kinase
MNSNRYNHAMPNELHIPSELDLTAFISKEAHDLKSPFNRALGFLKLVLKGMDGPISDQAKEDLTIAYLNMQYTLAMINALVDMARLGRGERHLTLDSHPVDYILQQTASEWQRKYHKENPVEINFSAPPIQIQADEIMIRQGISQWISYVNEFVQEDARIDIQVEAQSEVCQFNIESRGTKRQPPPECDLTMYGFVAQKILELHQGELLRLEETEQGACVQFRLPAAG